MALLFNQEQYAYLGKFIKEENDIIRGGMQTAVCVVPWIIETHYRIEIALDMREIFAKRVLLRSRINES